LYWTPAAARVGVATIEIDSTRQFQPILGFGAALTDASCYLLLGMAAASRQAFLREAFSPEGLNLNVGRCCIGSSDYSRSVYSYDDVPDDMNLDHFSLKHDEDYIVPTLREIQEINPSLFLLASPWSPPGWMKNRQRGLRTRLIAGNIQSRVRAARHRESPVLVQIANLTEPARRAWGQVTPVSWAEWEAARVPRAIRRSLKFLDQRRVAHRAPSGVAHRSLQERCSSQPTVNTSTAVSG
jgi:hypothetical protein